MPFLLDFLKTSLSCLKNGLLLRGWGIDWGYNRFWYILEEVWPYMLKNKTLLQNLKWTLQIHFPSSFAYVSLGLMHGSHVASHQMQNGEIGEVWVNLVKRDIPKHHKVSLFFESSEQNGPWNGLSLIHVWLGGLALWMVLKYRLECFANLL